MRILVIISEENLKGLNPCHNLLRRNRQKLREAVGDMFKFSMKMTINQKPRNKDLSQQKKKLSKQKFQR